MLNKCYSYLVPLLNEYCKIDSDYLLLLSNVYSRHYDYRQEEVITICYEFINNDPFLEYVENFRQNELFKEMFIDKEYLAITFYFPKEFRNEYYLYREGKFSRFSDRAKEVILKYVLDIHKLNDTERIRRVLYRDERLRKQLEEQLDMSIDSELELSSKPNLINETFIPMTNEIQQ